MWYVCLNFRYRKERDFFVLTHDRSYMISLNVGNFLSSWSSGSCMDISRKTHLGYPILGGKYVVCIL